jgi:hypothetical protein
LTPAEECKEWRDWFSDQKRDPAFLVAILGPVACAVVFGVIPTILTIAFPFGDARQSLQSVVPMTAPVTIYPQMVCKLPSGTYLFGYDVFARSRDPGSYLGRVCRDIRNERWIFSQ